MQKLSGRVYYVISPMDDTVLIALDVGFDEHYVRWFDTIKERMMTYERIVDTDSAHFSFERAGDESRGIYTFVPMTLALYNEHVKRHVLVSKEFTDEETLLREFEKTRENAW